MRDHNTDRKFWDWLSAHLKHLEENRHVVQREFIKLMEENDVKLCGNFGWESRFCNFIVTLLTEDAK